MPRQIIVKQVQRYFGADSELFDTEAEARLSFIRSRIEAEIVKEVFYANMRRSDVLDALLYQHRFVGRILAEEDPENALGYRDQEPE